VRLVRHRHHFGDGGLAEHFRLTARRPRPQTDRETSPWLDEDDIRLEVYLVNLLKGLAPPPMLVGDELYIGHSDKAAFRSRLRAESLKRVADLARHATEPEHSGAAHVD
jgi:hypothetical protein